MTKWDWRYYRLAQYVSSWSKDPSTVVGAVVVGTDRRKIALGYNGFPPRIRDDEERLKDKETKYALTQHAERNVLDNAAFDLIGSTLYVTAYPCAECAKSIVSKGVKRVVCPPPPREDPARPWTMSIRWTKLLFNESDIEVEVVDAED